MFRGLVLAFGVWCAAASAHATTLRMEYEGVAYGIFQFGRARIEVSVAPDRYDAAAAINTAGLAAIFASTRLGATSRGGFGAIGMAPSRYELDHRYRGVHRLSSVDWSGESVRVTAEPGFPFSPNPAPTEEQRRRGRDPLATILSMGAQVAREGRCGGVHRVFDGLYVYDLTLRDLGAGVYRLDEHEWPVLRCGLQQRRVAGYRRPQDLEKTLPEGEIWFAAPERGNVAMPVRFVSRLPLGEAVIRLTSISFGDTGEAAARRYGSLQR